MNQEILKILNQTTSTRLFETCKKDGKEISHFNFVYNEEESKLTVFVNYEHEYKTYFVAEYECDALTYAYILVGIINDGRWITSNPHKPNNVFVETNQVR